MGTVVGHSSHSMEIFRMIGAEDMDEEVGSGSDKSKGPDIGSSTC